jgi:hypothetical protein
MVRRRGPAQGSRKKRSPQNDTARPTPLNRLPFPALRALPVADLSNKVLNAPDVFAVSIDNAVFDKEYSLIKCVAPPGGAE